MTLTTSIKLTGFVRSASGLSILWAALDTALGGNTYVDPKLRQAIIDAEWLLKDGEPSTHGT